VAARAPDSSIDGAPLVLTTTDPLCVQILHHV
jgi:hypothetical protein